MLLNLKLYRGKLGMSQQEMADYLGISSAAYSYKETGANEFRDRERVAIKKLVQEKIDPDITIDEIFYTNVTPRKKRK